MKLGALLGPISADAPANTIARQAQILADAGYSSLWSAQAIGRGFMMSDPFVCLAAAAAATDLEIGTAVVQVPLYHPMDLAHRVFSLQQIAGNRFIFGVGAGSTANDFHAYGRNYESRFTDFDAAMKVLRTIFAEGGHGDSKLSPWPSIQGGPPVFLGTWGKGVERAASAFDGWIASAHYRTPDEVVAALARYREAGGVRAIVSTIQLSAETDLGELEARLRRFEDAGFDDAVVMFLPGAPAPEAVRELLR
jgi:alkanesulfonate monooxygenase SsuD/methylene tetrahydromethanopterin reductase-like flavin-dependent oxidoreductase (luciferase family)